MRSTSTSEPAEQVSAAPAPTAPVESPGNQSSNDRASRRSFLLTTGAAAGATALGAATAGVLVGQPAPKPISKPVTEPVADLTGPPIVAYLGDVSTGEITLMVGEREITVTDPQLAAALARKAR